MDTQTAHLYAEYNKKVNHDMNEIIGNLSDSQWNTELGGYYASIKSLCNHIYISDFNWLKRFPKLRDFDYIKNGIFSKEIVFGTITVNKIEEYIQSRGELDNCLTAFVQELTDTDINSTLEYTDSHGAIHHRNFGGLVLHMFNHETHHRGMISVYLEEMDVSNDYSNLSSIV